VKWDTLVFTCCPSPSPCYMLNSHLAWVMETRIIWDGGCCGSGTGYYLSIPRPNSSSCETYNRPEGAWRCSTVFPYPASHWSGCWGVRVTYRVCPAAEGVVLLPSRITCLAPRTNSLAESPLEIMGIYFHPISFYSSSNIIPDWFIYLSLRAAPWNYT
jgi:hypothetical protein